MRIVNTNVRRAFAAGAALAGLTTCTSAEHAAPPSRVTLAFPERAAPKVQPVAYLPLTAEQAIELNGASVLSDPGPAAAPFMLGRGPAFSRAADCLTAAIYYEAATEPVQGQRAVAQVVLNRVRHPAFPKSVCGVVYQGSERSTGCQFTFTCDGSMARVPVRSLWARAQRIAVAALEGTVEGSVGEATHYHADWVVPYWASSLTRSTSIGAHIFYRWSGFWGTPAAFKGRYAMAEPDPATLTARVETALAQPIDEAAIQAENRLTVASRTDPLPAAAPILRTLKADLEAGALRDELNGARPLAADTARVSLLADEGRTALN